MNQINYNTRNRKIKFSLHQRSFK